MARLKKLWAYEPVRLVLYSILTVVVGYFVLEGVVDESLADAVVLPIIAALLMVPATEIARKKVTPQAKIPDIVSERVDSAVAEVNDRVDSAVSQARDEIAERFGPQGTKVLDTVTQTVRDYVGRHRAG